MRLLYRVVMAVPVFIAAVLLIAVYGDDAADDFVTAFWRQ